MKRHIDKCCSVENSINSGILFSQVRVVLGCPDNTMKLQANDHIIALVQVNLNTIMPMIIAFDSDQFGKNYLQI